MAKKYNFKVTSRECRGNHERMIRKFIKKTKRERLIEEIRRRKKAPTCKRKAQ